MSLYAAVNVTGLAVDDEDLALAVVDDWAPVAAASGEHGLTVYFASDEQRRAACAALAAAFPAASVTPTDVDDEDWARRSQEQLEPIVVGRITVRPAGHGALVEAGTQPPGNGADGAIELVIRPSMGFGTGHHATTRLCLAALQRLDLRGRVMLDVGTGSGILALAARALGADRALGVDYDPDAIASARENLPLNPQLDRVSFELFDFTTQLLPVADVVAANLTGALLCRAASRIIEAVTPAGTLVLSGILASERNAVADAFRMLPLTWEAREDEWVALCFDRDRLAKV